MQFEETWYHQERTPGIQVTIEHDSIRNQFAMTCTQIIEKNTKGEEQRPFYYPFSIALFRPDGSKFDLSLVDNIIQNRLQDGILIISKAKETFVFEGIDIEPKISLNRSFSAPIRVYSEDIDHIFLMKYETDGFARYEAAQEYTIGVIRSIMDG